MNSLNLFPFIRKSSIVLTHVLGVNEGPKVKHQLRHRDARSRDQIEIFSCQDIFGQAVHVVVRAFLAASELIEVGLCDEVGPETLANFSQEIFVYELEALPASFKLKVKS